MVYSTFGIPSLLFTKYCVITYDLSMDVIDMPPAGRNDERSMLK